jgi:putative transposase
MKRSRFTEEQIIGVLKEHEAGVKTTDLCRKHGVSSATFFKWKSKSGGMNPREVADVIGQLVLSVPSLLRRRPQERMPWFADDFHLPGPQWPALLRGISAYPYARCDERYAQVS